ncbi:MAG: hypothetical protein L3J93_03065 [Thermoplasmata archaeon]|nr:hypothetical protein [Thermoplasmata archaeon]
MSGRPPGQTGPPALRLEILKELQLLIDNKEARERLDRGPLAETKGREHWVLHLLLRAQESGRTHTDQLVTAAFANLTARVQALDDRVSALSEHEGTTRADLLGRLDGLSTTLTKQMSSGFEAGTTRIADVVSERVQTDFDSRWHPVSESIERFAQGSKQMLKDVSDTYKVATQTRLLLNENARRISDLGRDIVALEDSLKLVIQRAMEEGLAPLEARVAQLETVAGVSPPVPAVNHSPAETPEPEKPAEPPHSDA